MTTIYKHILTALTLIAMLAMGIGAVVNAASADTGPWQWSDISENLGTTENRPVWASAFAHPYWYLTDGQELHSGGHVWKTDGAIMSDITVEIRNAGLSRVDDIVTDGTTILFLKNVVSNTRNFEILSYADGTWGYPANTWRSRLDSNEALASINGKDGTWIITTAKGRVFKWTQSTNAFEWINIPNAKSYSYSSTIYSVRHTSPIEGHNAFTTPVAVPVWDGWLIAAPDTNSNFRYWKLPTNGSLYELTNQFSNLNFLHAIASDGSKAIVAGGNSAYRTDSVHVYDSNGSNNNISTNNLPFSHWNDALIESNGKSWMILNNKNLVRLDNNYFTNYGETRDYFVTISGDKNGRFMVGGVVSAIGNSNPTSPLTAKLVRIDEGTGYVHNNPIVNTNNEVWASMSVSHNEHELYHGQSSNVNITGGSPNNIDRIEIWLNGDIVKTCYDNDCDYTIYGSSYTKGSSLSFNGRVVDSQDHEAWTWLGEYHVPVDNYYSNNDNYYNNNNYYNSDSRLSVWFDFSPSGNQMYSGDHKVIQAHANAQDGLKKLEIYVNDDIKRTCTFSTVYGDQNCNYTVYNSQYTSNNELKVFVKAYDNYGRQIQTNEQYINRDGYWDNNDNNNYDSSVAAWFDGNVSKNTLDRDESRNITFYGNANRGLDRLELYANGDQIGSCNFNGSYGDKTCSKTIYGNNFNAGQSVTLKVKATDRDGYQNWSGTINFSIEDDGSNNNNNGDDINTWMWFEPSDTTLDDNESKTIKVNASADVGLKRIDIYANNNVIKSCTYSRAYGTQNCEVSIYGNNYNNNSTISIYAKALDYYSRTDTSETKNIYRNGSNNNNNNGTEVYAWMWLDPSDNNLDQNETKTINVGASADSGLQKVEIYADGSLKKTCTYNRAYGNQECSVAIYGNNFSSNRNINIFARAYDYNGRMTQTSSENVYVTGTDNNNNNQSNVDGNLTITSNRDSGYTNYEQITFTANGSDNNGINKIEILVNAIVVKTCSNSSTCSYTGGPYTTETVSYGANLYDDLGNRTWTGYTTLYRK